MDSGEVGLHDIYDVLLELKQGFGSLESTVQASNKALAAHIEDDKAMNADIQTLKLNVAKQSGAIRAVAVIGTVLGSIGGSLIAIFTRSHS